MSDVQNYLHYLQTTLGLDHVILPEKKAQKNKKLHIQCVTEKALTAEESEMFEKIIAALKLSPTSTVVSVASQVAAFEAPVVVLFTDDSALRGAWSDESAARVLRTFSIASMLRDPSLKKQCWAHLQTILQ